MHYTHFTHPWLKSLTGPFQWRAWWLILLIFPNEWGRACELFCTADSIQNCSTSRRKAQAERLWVTCHRRTRLRESAGLCCKNGIGEMASGELLADWDWRRMRMCCWPGGGGRSSPWVFTSSLLLSEELLLLPAGHKPSCNSATTKLLPSYICG